MKNKTYILNTLLTAVIGLCLLIFIFVRTFAPAVIIPALNIPNMVLISLLALLLDHYLFPGAKRCYICVPLFSAAAFGLLPYAACFVTGAAALKLALIGGITITATTWLFSTIQDRLSSGPAAKASAFFSAVSL